MKKSLVICIVIIILLSAALIFVLMTKDNSVEQPNNQGTIIDDENNQGEVIDNGNTAAIVKKVREGEPLITTGSSYNEPNELNAEISIPYINIDTEEARKANEELETLYRDACNSIVVQGEGFGSYTSVGYRNIDSEKYVSSVVAVNDLVIPGGGFVASFIPYNIEKETGKILTNADILRSFNMTEEDFINKTKVGLEKFYEEALAREEMDGTDIMTLDTFLSKTKITMENAMYINENGKITVIVLGEDPVIGWDVNMEIEIQ